MSASSDLGFVLPLHGASFTKYEPVSSFRAWCMRNNLLHLIDVCSQTRINWTSGPMDRDDHYALPAAAPDTAGDSGGVAWCQQFPHTWVRPSRPVNLDIRITLRAEFEPSGDVVAVARIVPAEFPEGDLSAPNLWLRGLSFTAGSGTWSAPVVFADEQVFFVDNPPTDGVSRELMALYSSGPEDDGVLYQPFLTMARLEIFLRKVASEYAVAVSSVYVREFVS